MYVNKAKPTRVYWNAKEEKRLWKRVKKYSRDTKDGTPPLDGTTPRATQNDTIVDFNNRYIELGVGDLSCIHTSKSDSAQELCEFILTIFLRQRKTHQKTHHCSIHLGIYWSKVAEKMGNGKSAKIMSFRLTQFWILTQTR